MRQLKVTSIQRHCVHDGPGIRTTVFLKGCHLQCPWCCNPETQSQKTEYYFENDKCLHFKGIHSELCADCIIEGGSTDKYRCKLGASTPTCTLYSTYELYEYLIRDINLYRLSQGGVTFSGGEPFLHGYDIIPLLKLLKQQDVSVFFESTLFLSITNIEPVIDYIDGIIIDLKLQKEMFFSDSDYIQTISNNLRFLKEKQTKLTFRLVCLDSMILYIDAINNRLKELNIPTIELLQCHNLGYSKYLKLGKRFKDYKCSTDNLNYIAKYLNVPSKILTV